jgi:hypothetical protein
VALENAPVVEVFDAVEQDGENVGRVELGQWFPLADADRHGPPGVGIF